MFKTIGIISNGKFSQLMQEVFAKTLPAIQVKVSSTSSPVDNKSIFSFEEVCACDILIPAVPIRHFEKVLKEATLHMRSETLVIDVCTIKVYPKEIMQKILGEKFEFICTHPMFGPESYKNNNNSVKGLNVMVENGTASKENFAVILSFLKELELNVIEISCDEHDRLASEFQFTTLFTALMLKDLGIKRTNIDTASASRMHDFVERVGNDLEILQDMYKFNPYCRKQMEKITKSFDKMSGSIN